MSISLNTELIPQSHWLTHPEGRIFVRVWGSNLPFHEQALPPVVLFHDSLGCVDLWRDFPARLSLATGRTVIAYDRLGFGRSAQRKAPLPPDFIADEAATCFPFIRSALGFRRFVAFGHSVGGAMAAHCAARYPVDCEMLITESAVAFVEEQTLQGIRAAKEMFADPVQFQRLERYHGPRAVWVLRAWADTWLSDRFASWSLAEELDPIYAPAMIIHGSLDEFGTLRQPEQIARLCKGKSRVEIIPDTYHVPHREQPDGVLARVAAFLGDGAALSAVP